MENNKYYTIKIIDEYEFSEIDFDLYREIFNLTSEEENSDGDGWYKPIGHYNRDGCPLQIDRLISKLEEFKKKGANYVSLEYHEDHIGYPMEALNISQSTTEEIEKLEGKESKKKKIEKEYNDQIKKLSEEAKRKISEL